VPQLLDSLRDPGASYRPVPFWSWNDRLDPEELRLQIRQMHEAGLGGYFMHARGGLLTEYLGDDWFECVRACLDEGAKLGMDSWAYDENGWPSGFGDGLVNGLGLAFQQKYLRLEVVDVAETRDAGRDIAWYDAASAVLLPERPAAGQALRLYYDVNPYYVDTLDGAVTDVFLEKIYQRYQSSLDSRDWGNMRGFFTDEPQVSRNGIPWSFTLEREYAKEYGEPLLPSLPALFRGVEGHRRVRYRFWRLVTLLFMNNFMKPIHAWCEAHGCMVTGHHVLEETYDSQLTSNGAVMPQYQYYHIPGMDRLGRGIRPITTPVQLASVCAQTGKRKILSETFACCGWNVRLEDMKWLYQWQMAHGVNLLCQHLESYSLKGIRKRDYPASLFRHQPWWPGYRCFNDYVARLGVLLSEGEINVDTLILHGQSSAWLGFDGKSPAATTAYFESFNQLSELFDRAHVNFHYGDETMIAMHGKVEGASLVIGAQRYRLLVVPQLCNFSPEVFAALRDFTAAGGTVLAVENRVEPGLCLVGGERREGVEALLGKFVWFGSERELAASLGSHVDVCPVVKPGAPPNDFDAQLAEIVVACRHFADLGGAPAEIFYFTNSDLQNGYDAEIHLDAKGVERFDPASGEFLPVHFRREGGKLVLPHYFCAAGDLVLATRPEAAPAPAVEPFRRDPATLGSGRPPMPLDGAFKLDRLTPNLLTLDHCSFWFDGELQAEGEYVLCVQDRLLKLKRPVDVELLFRFEADASYDLGGELFLVMEIPERFTVELNGRSVPMLDRGELFDSAFRKIDITGLPRHGENQLRLKTRFSQPDAVYQRIEAAKVFEAEKNKLSFSMEIEAIYLAGAFGVKSLGPLVPLEREAYRCSGGFALCARPETAELGKVHASNLPFFAGTATLSKDFVLAPGREGLRFLAFDRQLATLAKFRLNGVELGTFAWRPYLADVSGLLRPGVNHLEVELTNSLRNLLGPHHLGEGETYGVGPSTFYKEPGVFGRGMASWPGGWDDGYCFVEFGVAGLRLL